MKHMINDIFTIIRSIFEGDEELTDLMIIGYLLPPFYNVIRMFIPVTFETYKVLMVLFDIATYGAMFAILVTLVRLGKAAIEYVELLAELEEEES